MKNTGKHIGSEAAKAAVLVYSEIRREEAEFTFCSLEHDSFGELYHIVFDACMLSYECYVDALTGEVRGIITEPAEMDRIEVSACA